MVEQQFASVDDYIDSFPDDVQLVLCELRRTIRSEAPAARESISYHMPTYTTGDRPLVFFAGWKTHVALYAIPTFDGDLETELAPYRAAKDTLKFSLRKPVPYPLVSRVVRELVQGRGGS
ncbi:iron chaperone [Herbiconiux sp. UC225_62]|uniref:iron chaperone n=1 Tax=Herbiconiux sp. UC225_62 TaxID=3350168 RepID=UPI0036D2B5FA